MDSERAAARDTQPNLQTFLELNKTDFGRKEERKSDLKHDP